MPVFSQFTTPAGQSAQDFQSLAPGLRTEFEQAWSSFVNASVETSQLGNPWNSVNDTPRALYFNPLGTDIDEATLPNAPVQWNAFPNRLNAYLYPAHNLTQRWQIADTGVQGLQSPQNPCASPVVPVPFGPHGPRGWQDEYCEWAVTRDTSGKLTSVMFTCENPEYWFLLWNVSPSLVTTLYQRTLNAPEVQEADLYLLGADGQPVTDPQTQRPAYNPINKWNSGTQTVRGSGAASRGGAMHLTSPPNSLGAEIYLAAAATIQRVSGTPPARISDAATLICCAQYGQPNRNSDPHIGQSVNQAVFNAGGTPNQVTLLDPVGLYLQLPYAAAFNGTFTPPATNSIPAGKTLMDCWTVVRGAANYPGYPNNAALHLVFEVPQEWGFAVGDINMSYTSPLGEPYNGPVLYGAQLVEFLQVQLTAVAMPAKEAAQSLSCVQDTSAAATLPSPAYLVDQAVFEASLYNKLDRFANLTPQLLTLNQGETRAKLALQASNASADTSISFGDAVTVQVEGYDDSLGVFTLTLTVAEDAAPGQRTLLLSQPNGPAGVAAPAYLQINAAPVASLRARHRFSRL